eukprot:1186304-Prorocentrum_minimum.AAC.2
MRNYNKHIETFSARLAPCPRPAPMSPSREISDVQRSTAPRASTQSVIISIFVVIRNMFVPRGNRGVFSRSVLHVPVRGRNIQGTFQEQANGAAFGSLRGRRRDYKP